VHRDAEPGGAGDAGLAVVTEVTVTVDWTAGAALLADGLADAWPQPASPAATAAIAIPTLGDHACICPV
jgi:hypothetical protein